MGTDVSYDTLQFTRVIFALPRPEGESHPKVNHKCIPPYSYNGIFIFSNK